LVRRDDDEAVEVGLRRDRAPHAKAQDLQRTVARDHRGPGTQRALGRIERMRPPHVDHHRVHCFVEFQVIECLAEFHAQASPHQAAVVVQQTCEPLGVAGGQLGNRDDITVQLGLRSLGLVGFAHHVECTILTGRERPRRMAAGGP
jgi:hypothetical protein